MRGLTIVEFVIVGSLITFIGASLLDFFLRQSDFIQISTAQAELQVQGQLAIDAVASELRHATRADAGSPPNVTIPNSPNNSQLTFYLPTDADGNGVITDAAGAIEWVTATPVTFQYAAGTRRLLRSTAAGSRVLANDVTAAVFEDRNIDGTLLANEVRVRLTLQKTAGRRSLSTTLSGIITLRN